MSGGPSTYGSRIIADKLPLVVHGTVDLTTSAVGTRVYAPYRMEIVGLYTRVRTAPTATTVVKFGINGDDDEFLTSGHSVATGDGGVEIDLAGSLTDPFVEAGETIEVASSGTASSAGELDFFMVLQPAGA